MVWVDREGREQALSAPPMAYRNLELSPTKDRVAVTVGQPGASDIWVYALDENRLSRLTFEGGARATWMGDERLAFMRVVGESTMDNDLFTRRADGAGTVTRLTDDEAASAPSDFSSADDLVGTMNWDLAILASSPGQESRVLLATDSVELQPRVSPDGRWLAYVSNESGSYEVYVRPFPDVTSGRWQISRNGGGSPVWSADGSELFFISVDKEMMAAPIADEGGSLVSGSPRALFDARPYPRWHFYFGPSVPEFDVSADGQRFLMIKPVQAAQRTAHIVVNWLDELERLVPRP